MSRTFKAIVMTILVFTALMYLGLAQSAQRTAEENEKSVKLNNVYVCRTLGLDREHCFLLEPRDR